MDQLSAGTAGRGVTMPGPKLLTREIEKKLPPLRSTDGRDPKDVPVLAKFFNPCGRGSWFPVEYDPTERLFFGFAEITDGELGYFSLDELERFRGPLGLEIERDLWWDPDTKLADVIAGRVR
jgi:hypothetical protein